MDFERVPICLTSFATLLLKNNKIRIKVKYIEYERFVRKFLYSEHILISIFNAFYFTNYTLINSLHIFQTIIVGHVQNPPAIKINPVKFNNRLPIDGRSQVCYTISVISCLGKIANYKLVPFLN